MGDCYGGEEVVLGDACVVDEDVDLELGGGVELFEVGFGGCDEGLGSFGRAHVGLDCEGLDVVFCAQVCCELFGWGLGGRGGVAQDEVAAFCGEVLGDGDADAWMVKLCLDDVVKLMVMESLTSRGAGHDSELAIERT